MTTRKTIFITGGGSGIGRAVAQTFAGQGWFVGLADIDEAGMRATAVLLPEGACSLHQLDVRDRAAWDVALVACAEKSGDRIDVVFNNAGIPLGGQIIDHSVAEIERCLDINLNGVLYKVPPDLAVFDALKSLAEFGVGAVLVMDGERMRSEERRVGKEC